MSQYQSEKRPAKATGASAIQTQPIIKAGSAARKERGKRPPSATGSKGERSRPVSAFGLRKTVAPHLLNPSATGGNSAMQGRGRR